MHNKFTTRYYAKFYIQMFNKVLILKAMLGFKRYLRFIWVISWITRKLACVGASISRYIVLKLTRLTRYLNNLEPNLNSVECAKIELCGTTYN